MSGTNFCRRAPKRIALIGTPSGFSHSGEYVGLCFIETVKRALGCAAGWPPSGSQGLPRQSCALSGTGSSRSEEHTSELQSQSNLVCRLLLEKKKKKKKKH